MEKILEFIKPLSSCLYCRDCCWFRKDVLNGVTISDLKKFISECTRIASICSKHKGANKRREALRDAKLWSLVREMTTIIYNPQPYLLLEDFVDKLLVKYVQKMSMMD
ncbi:hypothetical protein L596_006268 [Steinernema carpocapsae]|uniref:Uncharacterized protein n=1 Tax=Steinernema carpocapsae TaxID=34508 RepID=A0A4U8V1T2_STECR|nr:hypothetical protein L596_006268 [Steinernema carpocapsae]